MIPSLNHLAQVAGFFQFPREREVLNCVPKPSWPKAGATVPLCGALIGFKISKVRRAPLVPGGNARAASGIPTREKTLETAVPPTRSISGPAGKTKADVEPRKP